MNNAMTRPLPIQLPIVGLTPQSPDRAGFGDPAFAVNKQAPIHRWVPWIAGFSREFVKDAFNKYLPSSGAMVLEPFAGVGTTLVEALVAGHNAVGFEINPFAAFACKVKVNARSVRVDTLEHCIAQFRQFTTSTQIYWPKSIPPENFKSRAPFYSPDVLKKVLTALDFIEGMEQNHESDLFRLAFASTMVQYSNYSYEPSLGRRVSAGKEEIHAYPVYETIGAKLDEMLADIRWLKQAVGTKTISGQVINRSFFEFEEYIAPDSIDLVVTSPPYLNNYHYNRNTRPQLFWLGLATSPKDLKPLEEMNFGKFWQTVRERERVDLSFKPHDDELPQVIEQLRSINKAKGIYGGNGWANYAASYFNDCYRLSLGLKHSLRPGGTALIVVGNSVVQGVDIAVDRYLGEIAQSVGLRLVDIHFPRTKRVGDSIVNSGLRTTSQSKRPKLYEAVVELTKD